LSDDATDRVVVEVDPGSQRNRLVKIEVRAVGHFDVAARPVQLIRAVWAPESIRSQRGSADRAPVVSVSAFVLGIAIERVESRETGFTHATGSATALTGSASGSAAALTGSASGSTTALTGSASGSATALPGSTSVSATALP
jgi:hypothetical protein